MADSSKPEEIGRMRETDVRNNRRVSDGENQMAGERHFISEGVKQRKHRN
jgi:hypothetical protein